MVTIKSFTDLSQSKKLAEFLPLESADMIWVLANPDLPMIKAIAYEDSEKSKYYEVLPAWSLAALLGIIKSAADYTMQSVNCKESFIVCELDDKPWNITAQNDNEIDACVEMIVKLHELNLL